MKAIILAAGKGSRLGDLGKNVPKCLLKINGQSTLERLVRALRNLWPLLSSSLTIQGFRLQLYGGEMLQAVMEESDSLKIKPFLVWGTLLGCIREGGFIRNDEDVDLGLLDSDFAAVEELKGRMLKRGFSVRRQSEDKISFFHPVEDGLWIDIDRFFEMDGTIWTKNETVEGDLIYAYYFQGNVFSQLLTRFLEGTEVFVPVRFDTFLQAVYGTWRIPQQKREIRRGPLNLYLEKKKIS